MADAKISALTELTAPAADDEFVVVDKSDTTMAASGTDKRIKYGTLQNPPCCRVYNSAEHLGRQRHRSRPSTFNCERYDTDSMHSTSSNTGRITFTTAGVYSSSGNVDFACNATGRHDVWIRLNGTTTIAQI